MVQSPHYLLTVPALGGRSDSIHPYSQSTQPAAAAWGTRSGDDCSVMPLGTAEATVGLGVPEEQPSHRDHSSCSAPTWRAMSGPQGVAHHSTQSRVCENANSS